VVVALGATRVAVLCGVVRFSRITRAVAFAVVALTVVAGCASEETSGSETTASGSVATRDQGAAPSSAPPGDCPTGPPESLVPQIVAEYPHDPEAFTQGLLVVDDQLYEGTGLGGRSTVRRVDLTTGEPLLSVTIPGPEFGEGIAETADGRLVQLTWTEGVAFVRDPLTLEVLDTWSYDGEGWGLTTLDDGTFVQSDGTSTLTWRDGATFEPTDRRTITRTDGPVDQLNELDWDGTSLWANRWRVDEIVRIDLRCGRVDAVVDTTSLSESIRSRPVPDGLKPPDVLNGVAHLPGTDRFLVTGKLWPALFEVRFVPAETEVSSTR